MTPYFCEKCQKEHANAYKVHLKYKKEPEIKSHPPDELEYLKEKVDGILEILDVWGFYLDRKHPYWEIDEKFKKLVEK